MVYQRIYGDDSGMGYCCSSHIMQSMGVSWNGGTQMDGLYIYIMANLIKWMLNRATPILGHLQM